MPSTRAIQPSSGRAGPSRLPPASAARTWISRNTRVRSGRPWQARASAVTSAVKSKPGDLPSV